MAATSRQAALASVRQVTTVTIAAGESVSSVGNGVGLALRRVLVGTDVQGASLVLLHSSSPDGAFLPSTSREGMPIPILFTSGTGGAIELTSSNLPGQLIYEGVRWFKLRTCSDTAGTTPQVQTNARSIDVVVVE